MVAMRQFVESPIQSDIVRNYEAGRTTLCREDFELLRDFSLDSGFASHFNLGNASMVTPSGIIGIQNIARRFQENFPDILTTTYSPERFLFRQTGTVRVNQTIRFFAAGLFGEAAESVVYEDVPERDWLLGAIDVCPEFLEGGEKYWLRREAFRNGPEMQEMFEQFNQRLGFSSNVFNIDGVKMMWDWCRLEVAGTFEESNSETGPNGHWCAAFSVAHHLLLEYYQDVGHYYRTGYGEPNQRLLENLSCGLMQDLIDHMQSESQQTSRIYMGEWEPIQLMLLLLGSFRDVWPLHEHNFAQQTDRNFLISLIAPFGANLAVVRHE